MSPQRLGKYELTDRLGEGGMAEVFRARLPGAAGFEKIVVIKRILPELVKRPDVVRMFVAEAKLAAHIIHRNIVQVLELVDDGGELFMVLEYVDGTDLRKILQIASRNRLRVPPWFAVQVMTEVLAGLGFAHELKDQQGRPRNVVHRDVSPGNIFLSRAGEVKLGDFGVAKDHSLGEETQTGTIKGKLAYMSPEQLYHKQLDQRADVFAAGVVLWEMLTQRRLFGGKRPDIEIMNLICSGPRVPPSTMCGDVPAELDACVLRALKPSPSQRFLTARDMQNHLLQILHTLKPRPLADDVRDIVLDFLRVQLDERGESDSGRGFGSSSSSIPAKPGIRAHAVAFDADVVEEEPLSTPTAKYTGPFPFWLDESAKVSGPFSYFDTLVVAREHVHAGKEILLSPDGSKWIDGTRFAQLTGQEALFSTDETRDLAATPHGVLEDRSVVSLLSLLGEQGSTSRLTLVSDQHGREMRVEVTFDEGRPIYVSSNLFRLQLPEVLTASGLVASWQLPELFHRVLSSEEPLERVVARTQQDWTEESIRLHLMKERLVALLSWRSGAFTIHEGVRVVGTPFVDSLLPLLASSIEAALSESALTEELSSQLATKFSISRRFARGISALGLDPVQFDIARALARGETIEALAAARPKESLRVLATAYLLRETKLLEATKPA